MHHQLDFRKFTAKDFDDYFKLVSDVRVMAYITERAIPLQEARKNYQVILGRNKGNSIPGSYRVVIDSTNESIGLAHLTVDEAKTAEAEIGYMLLPEYWGQGYGSTIAGRLVNMATQSNIRVLKAIIDPNNLPSRKILTKLGFSSVKLCEMGGLPGEILSVNLGETK